MDEQLLKTSGADVLSSGKTQKNLCGVSIHRHPPLVRPWVKPCRAGLETGWVKYRLGGLDFVLSFLFPLFLRIVWCYF